MSADLFAEFTNVTQSPPVDATHQTAPVSRHAEQPLQLLGQEPSRTSHDARGSRQWTNPNAESPSFSPWGVPNAAEGNARNTADGLGLDIADDDDDNDDGWGDFETAEAQHSVKPTTHDNTAQWSNTLESRQTTPREPPKPNIVRAPTFELMTNSLVELDVPKDHVKRVEWDTGKVKHRLRDEPQDPSVLFDAADFELAPGEDGHDDEQADDDFGEFETGLSIPAQPTSVNRPTAQAGKSPSADLLDLGFDEPTQSAAVAPSAEVLGCNAGLMGFGPTLNACPQAPKSPSFQERNPFPNLALSTPTTSATSNHGDAKDETPATAWPTFDPAASGAYDDENAGWGAWDEPTRAEPKKADDIDACDPPDSWDWDAVDDAKPRPAQLIAPIKSSPTTAPPDSAPPTNVPPPSVVLSIFPDLLGSAKQLFDPLSSRHQSIKDRVLSDPKAADFLQGYILLVSTAAHVIAGRKHRWHRDKILAKSMSISAAGSKGMKLAGVDKTQAAREDREAADVVAAWQEYVGRLRSAVAAANTARSKPALRLPELSTSMQVQTAKMVPTAAKPCIICGLKRDERVVKVDQDIEDSFGEWWIEHWGHRACRSFWLEHEQRLRQR